MPHIRINIDKMIVTHCVVSGKISVYSKAEEFHYRMLEECVYDRGSHSVRHLKFNTQMYNVLIKY